MSLVYSGPRLVPLVCHVCDFTGKRHDVEIELSRGGGGLLMHLYELFDEPFGIWQLLSNRPEFYREFPVPVAILNVVSLKKGSGIVSGLTACTAFGDSKSLLLIISPVSSGKTWKELMLLSTYATGAYEQM